MSEWHEWDTEIDLCPVTPKTIVEVRVLRLDGVEWQDAGYAENYDWSRVIEFRVVG